MEKEDLNKFNPVDFETKWQKEWLKNRVYQPDFEKAKNPYYNLMMFPYPSAEGLHVGNMYAFTGVDIHGRFQRMRRYDVFEPIGLDGFGIHSENYAIKIGKNPKEQSKVSEANFYRQLLAIGNGFAWENRLETYDPDYYKWTQWVFIQMFKKGLAYRKKSAVNFCPSCKTVLSDEQVIDARPPSSSLSGEVGRGHCERCKSLVEKREMEQWFFKITDYAERLLQNTYRKDFNWTNKVKIGQQNWIGKKTGINITYQVVDEKGQPATPRPSPISKNSPLTTHHSPQTITVFTTRPDTNFGATFVVVGPEHPFVASLIKSLKQPKLRKQLIDYIEKTKKTSEADRIAQGRKKTGVFTGLYAHNPLTDKKMPIYVADFVLGHVGTGAVVGVPGHDLRDFEFAKEFKLPIIRVVVGEDGDKSEIKKPEQVQEEEGKMINSGFLDGLEIHQAMEKIMDHLEKKGWGTRVTTYKLRDWCISRQRYWGAPIPMIFCQKCADSGLSWHSLKTPKKLKPLKEKSTGDLMPGYFPVPDSDLPVLLPDLIDWKPEGTGKGPLAKLKSFVEVACPECGSPARRETDVCDTFLDSAWYFLRYPFVQKTETRKQETKNTLTTHHSPLTTNSLPWDPQIIKAWLPVTSYIGGAEHTVLHLLYARFVTMAFHDMGYLDFDEPFKRFFAHGLIIAEGAKMSKSRGNVIIPDEYIRKYGADTLRTYLMFLGPYDAGGDFRDTGIAGMHKFLGRVWRLVQSFPPKLLKQPKLPKQDDSLTRIMHKTIRDVTVELEHLRYNTAIAKIMEFVNYLTENKQQITNKKDHKENAPLTTHHSPLTTNSQQAKESIKTLLLLLAPFAPHMTEELWQQFSKWEVRNDNKENEMGSEKIDKSHLSPQDPASHLSSHTSIHVQKWPLFDPKYLVEDEVTIAVQVNGKLRDAIKIPFATAQGKQKEVEEIVKKSENIKKHLEGKTIRKVIFIPGRLINFVI